MLRPGLGYLGFSTRNDAAAFGIPFIFGTNDLAILEVTDSHLRVIVDDALVTRGSVSTVIPFGDFTANTGWTLTPGGGLANIDVNAPDSLYLAAGGSGDLASCARQITVDAADQGDEHALRIEVTRGPVTFMVGSTSGGGEYVSKTELGTGIHSIAFTPTGDFYLRFETATIHGVVVDSVSVESAGTFDLPTPWAAADLSNLRYDQSGDVVFVACDGYQQRRIERRNNNSWSVVKYETDTGPFQTQNLDKSRTIVASETTGDVTLFGTNTEFSDADVDSLIRLDESTMGLIPQWEAEETVSIPTEAMPSSSTYIGDFTNPANAFDGNTASVATVAAASGYVGRTHASDGTVYSMRVRFTISQAVPHQVQVGLTIYAKQGSAPVANNDGTFLGTVAVVGSSLTSFDATAYSSDSTTDWDHVWVRVTAPTTVTGWSVSEIDAKQFTSTGVPVLRRYDGNVYQAVAGTNAGFIPPTHTIGDLLSAPSGVIWRYRHGPWGAVRITSVANSAQAAGVVTKTLPDSITAEAGWSWAYGDWSHRNGWPTEVKFHEGRLGWFRGDKFWISVSDDYTNYNTDTIGDSGPIIRSFGSGPIAKINFALSLTRLIIGREMSIDPLRSSSQEEPLTPTNHSTKTCSTKGAAEFPALKVGTRGLYVEKSGRRVYGLSYSAEAGDYVSADLTRLNHDIGIPGFVSLAVQEQPETSEIFVKTDGQIAILLDDSEVNCWWRIQTLGVIERVVVLPGALEDRVYCVVKRTINGGTKRFWEKFALRTQCVGGSLSRLADSYLSISQPSSTTITGLSHLEGESVIVWANGKDLGSYTVSSGSITVSEAVTTAIVGLGGVSFSYNSSTAAASVTAATKYNGYPAEVFADGKYVGCITVSGGLVTLPNGRAARKIAAYLGYYGVFRSAKLAYGAQMGTALTQHKRIEKIGIIAYDTHYQGLQYGSSIDNLQPLPLVEGGQDTAADTVWSEFDQPMIGLSGSWDTDSRLHLLAQAPKPVTLEGVVMAVSTLEAR